MDQFNSLIIKRTSKTPQINLDLLSGEIMLSGSSIPENATKIYKPVLKWVKNYTTHARPITNLRIDLDHFNTSSSLWISEIIRVLNCIEDPDHTLMVHLYIPLEEFDQMREFEDLCNLFCPAAGIFQNTKSSVGLKLYAINYKSEIVKDALVLRNLEELSN